MKKQKLITKSVAKMVLFVLVAVLAIGSASAAFGSMLFLPVVMRASEPTVTPTINHQPTATIEPTPMGTPLPAVVEVLPNHSTYIDSIDYLHIVGEVQNKTGETIDLIRVTANFFLGGTLVATDYSYLYIDVLPPGEKSCFNISLLPPAGGYDSIQFEPPHYYTDATFVPGLAVIGPSGSVNSYGWYEIIGQISNQGAVRQEYVSAVGTLYDPFGVVLGCSQGYVSSTDLDPGQTSSFKMSFYSGNFMIVNTFRVQPDGNPE